MSDHEEALHDGQELGGGWTAYADDSSRFYYYNSETGETQWERPDEAVALTTTPRDDGGERTGGAGEERRPAYDYQNDAATPDTATPVRSPCDDLGGGLESSPGDGAGGDDADGGADGVTDPPAVDGGIPQSPPLGDDGGIPRSPPAEAMEGVSPRDEPAEPVDEPTPDATAEQTAEEQTEEQTEEELHDGQELGGGWVAYKDDEGRFYYYNGDSGETQWERPEVAPGTASGVNDVGDSAGDEEAKVEPVSEAQETQAEVKTEAATVEQKSEPQVEEEEKPAEAVVTPEEFLGQPDAIMEPGVLDRIDDLVRDRGAGSALPFAAKTLAAGYGGDTSVCGLLGLWLAELTAMRGGDSAAASAATGSQTVGSPSKAAGPGDRGRLFGEGADRARDAAEGVIGRLVKERFEKKDGDSIMGLSKKQVRSLLP